MLGYENQVYCNYVSIPFLFIEQRTTFNIDIFFEIYYWAMYDAIMKTTRIPTDSIEMRGQ